MKILFSGERYYPPKGGAEKSIMTLLHRLAEKHEVEAFCLGNETKVIEDDGIKFIMARRGVESNNSLGLARFIFLKEKWRVLDEYVKESRPDLIIAQDDSAPYTIEIALKYGIPNMIFLRDYNYICITMFIGMDKCERHSCVKHVGVRKLVQYPFFKWLSKWYEGVLHRSGILLANSMFTRDAFRSCLGVDSEVVYPFIELKKYDVKDRRYITFIKPKDYKGVGMFLKIAKAMTDKEFLVAGESSPAIAKILKGMPNVKYMGWIKDMGEVYSQTRAMIIPSQWPETFCRSAVEAGISGIPSIASAVGAMSRESVDGAGVMVKNYKSVDAWTTAIKSLDDAKLYKRLSDLSIEHAKKYDLDTVYGNFERILEEYMCTDTDVERKWKPSYNLSDFIIPILVPLSLAISLLAASLQYLARKVHEL